MVKVAFSVPWVEMGVAVGLGEAVGLPVAVAEGVGEGVVPAWPEFLPKKYAAATPKRKINAMGIYLAYFCGITKLSYRGLTVQVKLVSLGKLLPRNRVFALELNFVDDK